MKQFHLQSNLFRQGLTGASVFASRLDMLPANISPLGSFGFFGHPVIFGASVVAFDLFVKGIYPGFWLTYLGFACYPLLSYLAKDKLERQVVLLPMASFLFFLLSNLGVWWYWYDHTLAKLLLCYSLAVPFYARTLLSDVVFGYGYLVFKNRDEIQEKISKLKTTFAVI